MELNQIKNYILKNLYTGLTKTFFTLLISIIAIPLTIKYIGIDKYGIISIVLLFSSFTGILNLGLSRALIFFEGSQADHRKEISNIYLLNFLISAILIVAGINIYFFDINLLGKSLNVQNETLRLINFIAILLLALDLINNLFRAALEARFKLHIVNWGFLIQSAIINLGWLYLALKNSDIQLFLYVPLIATIFTIVYHFLFLPTMAETIKRPDRKSLNQVLLVTSQFFKVGVLNSVHLPIIKYSIIIFLGEGRAYGIFELSTRLSIITNSILAYISNPFFSITSKHQIRNEAYLRRVIKKVTKLLVLIAIVGYMIFLLLNHHIIQYFFKVYSTEIFLVLNSLLVGYLFIAASESVQKYYLGIGKVNFVAKIKFLGILLNLLIMLATYLFHKIDIINIALAHSISLIFIGSFWLVTILLKPVFKSIK